MDRASWTCTGAPPISSTRSSRGEAGRPSGGAADQVRVCHQLEDRQGTRADDPAVAAARADEVIE